MLMSTADFSEQTYGSAYPFSLDEPNLIERTQDRLDTGVLRKQVLEALGASAWQSPHQTFNYRWRGEDTLDWGILDRWIQVKWLRGLIGSTRVEVRLEGYDALRQITAKMSDLHQVGELYSFCNAVDIQRFLYTHSQLTEILVKAHTYLQKHFGPSPQVTLELVSDPETIGWEQLYAYILTSPPVDKALARLDRFDEEWFIGQLDRVDGLLNFNLEFR